MNNKNEHILVSIITVCFNSENTIKDTIKSIINQTYKNIEYIIVDGGSTDSTLKIIKSYEPIFRKNKIKYNWISEKDKGLYDAMNKGIVKCTGELIGFINSDDWYDNDALQNIVDNFDHNIGLIHGNLLLCGLNGEIIKNLKPSSKKKSYLKGTPYLHPACFFNTVEVKKTGFYNLNYKIAADYDFMIKFIKAGNTIKYVDKNIGYFREGGISTTQVVDSLYESHLVRIQNGVNFLISYLMYSYLKWIFYLSKIYNKVIKS